ncbi:MAG: alpha/beta hydrolase [Chloroflexi bacterium]|nr:alpha/beta hydrolase [Chloroflexota bacterium]
MATANVNGMDMYYEVHGDGPAIVFAHGVGGNHASWYQQVPFFSRYYKVITVDQRGFGRSEDVNGLGRGAFVSDVKELLDQLGIGETCLVAQSMGGSTCMGFTTSYPERVSALVMADTLAGITMPEPLKTQQQQNAEATRDLSQLERVVGKGFPERNPAMAELYLEVASFNKSNENRFNMSGSMPPIQITFDQVKSAAEKVPMLFLVGENDILQPAAIVGAASKMVPNAQLAIVPDAGHSCYWEQPDIFNYQVHRFLSDALLHE